MFKHLLAFEWQFLRRSKAFYAMTIAFFAFGLVLGAAARFPFPNTFMNGTYVLTYVIGIASLLALFSTTLLAAPTLFREQEARFDEMLFATPLRHAPYIASRFTILAVVSAVCYLLLIAGMIVGLELRGDRAETGPFRLANYLVPFCVLLLPNIIFCTAVACVTGMLTRNKLTVYVSGIVIYFLYWGVAMFTNSPLIANSMPVSAASMHWSALLDPFGLAAFLEQSRYWTAAQRNLQLPALTGDLLINRLLYLALSLVLLLIAYVKFPLDLSGRGRARAVVRSGEEPPATAVLRTAVSADRLGYSWRSFRSLVAIEWQSILKSPALWIVTLAWMGYYLIETFSDIGGNTRLPASLPGSGRMIGGILEELPLVGVLVILFYANDSLWRRKNTGFAALEEATPLGRAAWLLSRWAPLFGVAGVLLGVSCLGGIMIQVIEGGAPVRLSLYLATFYYVGVPLILHAAIAVSAMALIRKKYVDIAVAGCLALVLNTSAAKILGLRHPVWRLSNNLQLPYSELNGFGRETGAFHAHMLFWALVACGLFLLASFDRGSGRSSTRKPLRTALTLIAFAGAVIAGTFLFNKESAPGPDEENDLHQLYEERYGFLKNQSHPVVSEVSANISLFPSEARYVVNGTYVLVNRSATAIDTLTVNLRPEMQDGRWSIDSSRVIATDPELGLTRILLARPILPGSSRRFAYSFAYKGSSFRKAYNANTIISNGSFVRISRYFPVIGYDAGREIEDPRERKRRKLSLENRLVALEAPTEDPGFISFRAVVSTDSDQTAICIGNLERRWSAGGRNYFAYATDRPVPFRFAVASGRYRLTRKMHRGVAIEVFSDPAHQRNTRALIDAAAQTLDYCHASFAPYPFRVARFVEISSITTGFAGTAYPGSLFIRESFGFMNKPDKTPERDILTEMVSHELAHAWWGNSGIAPGSREGSSILTETMAMYVELMVFKHRYGKQVLPDRVNVHRDIYLSERNSSPEEPFFRADPQKPYLCYDKGTLVMNRLHDLLGEDRLNLALGNFYRRFRYPGRPTTLDLVSALQEVASPDERKIIDRLFRGTGVQGL